MNPAFVVSLAGRSYGEIHVHIRSLRLLTLKALALKLTGSISTGLVTGRPGEKSETVPGNKRLPERSALGSS